MKSFNLMLASFAILSVPFFTAQATTPAPIPEKEVVMSISGAYVPSGFDAESEAYVIVHGTFPNGCYSWKRAEVQHDPVTRFHEVRSIARVRQTSCIMALFPFSQEVSLGRLEAGEHTVRFVSGDGTYWNKRLKVR